MKRFSSVSTEQTSNRRHPGSSPTEASAFAAMPARNSSRRPGRISICTIRLNMVVLSSVVVYNVYTVDRTTSSGGRMSRLSPEALRGFATSVLTATGVPDDDAALVADSLVQADLWGHQSHGVLRLPWYAARLRSGAMTTRTEPAVLSDTGPLVLLDGRHGIGQVLTERARTTAVERARIHGVGVAGVRNSNHFGTAMYWTRRAAQEGCVAVLTTNPS